MILYRDFFSSSVVTLIARELELLAVMKPLVIFLVRFRTLGTLWQSVGIACPVVDAECKPRVRRKVTMLAVERRQPVV